MILKTGTIISHGGFHYEVTGLLHSDKAGYREEYRAYAYGDNNKDMTEGVRLIVYKTDAATPTFNTDVTARREAMLCRELCGGAFDAFRMEFETMYDNSVALKVIVTDITEAKCLREAMAVSYTHLTLPTT